MKITNKNYRNFLDKGDIQLVTETHIKKALTNITGNYKDQAQALLLTLYYTGARPNEVLKLKSHDFTKEGSYLKIQITGSKGGLSRPVFLQLKNPLVSKIFTYTKTLPPQMFVFHKFKGNYQRVIQTKKGMHINENISDKLRYHVKKWFDNVFQDSIPPYYLRHSRFSSLVQQGATAEEIRQIKGARKLDSVFPYMHMSTETAKKNARKIQ